MAGINIVGLGSGFGINSWVPASAPIKGDGVWQSSPFIPGQQLTQRVPDDAIETFHLVCSGANEGEINRHISDFLVSMDAAVQFWTGQIALPDPYVYLELERGCGDFQYGIIKDYRFSEDDDITTIGKGFTVAKNCTLVVRHGPWRETPPGQYVNQPFGVDEYTGHVNAGAAWVLQKTGNPPADNDFKPVANFWTAADWTDLYIWDNSAGGIVGVNLLDTALPYDIWVPPSQVTDYLYFGITREGWGTVGFDQYVPVPNSITFTMDKALSSANSGLEANLALEYLNNVGVWTGVAIDALYINDTYAPFSDSNDLRQTFVIHWSRPAAQLMQVSGVAGIPVRTGYWFRLRPTVAGLRIRTLRHPYSVQRNFIRFDAADVPGDLAAPLRLRIWQTTDYAMKRVLMHLYRQERVMLDTWFTGVVGKNIDYFTSWFPAITNTHTYGGGRYNATWLVTAGGFATQTSPLNFHNVTDNNATPGAGWNGAPVLNTALNPVFYLRPVFGGRHRIFMVAKQTGGAIGEIGFRIANFARNGDGTPVWTSKTVTHKILAQWEILEFGEIMLPVSYNVIENIDDLRGLPVGAPSAISVDAFKPYLDFYGSAGNIGESILAFYIIPVDENFCEVFWPGVGPGVGAPDGNVIGALTRGSLTIDSAEYQKSVLRATVHGDFLTNLTHYPDTVYRAAYHLTPIAINQLQIPNGKTSRLYFLSMKYDAASRAWIYDDEPLMFVKAYRSAQYQLART